MDTFRKDSDVLRQIEKSREAIRRKHRLLKLGRETFEKAIDETFKPITEPLVKIVNSSAAASPKTATFKFKPKRNEYKSFGDTSFDETIRPHDTMYKSVIDKTFHTAYEDSDGEESAINTSLTKYLNLMKEKDIDLTFGVRKYGEQYMIGDSPVTFDGHKVQVKESSYPQTMGLLELLFKKEPNKELVTSADMNNYKEILEATNAHKKNYQKDERVNALNSKKYQKVIKSMFASTPKKGGGLLPRHKIAKLNTRMDYVYWDDPNELVDRLRLLVAERSAGNLIHTNEIHSIIEELREAGIIY